VKEHPWLKDIDWHSLLEMKLPPPFKTKVKGALLPKPLTEEEE
jgi:hypothetical protein